MNEFFDDKEFERLSLVLKEFLIKERKRPAGSRVDDFDLLRNYLEIKTVLRRVPKSKEMIMHGRYALNTYRNHFGGYREFLVLIGDLPEEFTENDLSEETEQVYLPSVLQLIQEMQRIRSQLGHFPSLEEIDAHAKYASKIYMHVFKDMKKLEEFLKR